MRIAFLLASGFEMRTRKPTPATRGAAGDWIASGKPCLLAVAAPKPKTVPAMKRLVDQWKRVICCLVVGGGVWSAAAAPFSAFTYQGRLEAGGNPANGNYDIRFGLFTNSAGGSPVAAVTNLNVAVSNGLFTTLVDFGASVFDGTVYWLELGVRTNGGGAFAVLSPRQDLTATPYAVYAVRAGQAAGVAPGAVPLAGLDTSSVDTRYVLKSGDIMSGGLVAPNLGGSSYITTPRLVGSNFLSIDSGSDIEFKIDANNGPVLSYFEVFNASNHVFWVNELGNGRIYGNFTADGTVTASSFSGSGAGLTSLNAGNLSTGFIPVARIADNSIGSAQVADSLDLGATNVSGTLNVYRTAASTPSISLFGINSQISTYGSDGLEQIRLWGPSYGELLLKNSGVGNETAVVLSANGTAGGYLNLNNSNGLLRATLRGYNIGGELALYTADGSLGVFARGEDGGAGSVRIYNTNGATRLLLDGQTASGGGGIYVYGGTGNAAADLTTDSYGGEFRLRDAAGAPTVLLDSSSAGGGYQYLYKADGGIGLFLDGDNSGAGYLVVYKTNGLAGIILDGQVSGNARITTEELQITGGSDLSEQFDIRAPEGTPQPGMLVCIDPARPGELVVSSKAYDRTVAGIISGAGGVKPGMLMGQVGTKADGKHPVALTGRVYCLADATHGAIQPGDLLTTSDTPGHAMKVSDPARAQGAIIGKAMTALPSGRGLVLVLVALQ